MYGFPRRRISYALRGLIRSGGWIGLVRPKEDPREDALTILRRLGYVSADVILEDGATTFYHPVSRWERHRTKGKGTRSLTVGHLTVAVYRNGALRMTIESDKELVEAERRRGGGE